MKLSFLKNIAFFAIGVISVGSLSAQFVIPSGIDNALQIIQRILVTTSGTSTGDIVLDINTGSNNIYFNPIYLPMSNPYSGDLVLTLNSLGYISFTNLTDFIENTSFNTNGTWTFGGDTFFDNSVTFSTGPVNFNNVTTNFSGGVVNNTNTTINNNSGTVINSSGTTFNNTNTTVTNNNVTTTNNGGTTYNNQTTTYNSGDVNNYYNSTNNYNSGTVNNYNDGSVTNYHSGSVITYYSGTTIVFQSGTTITGAAIVGPQGPQGPIGLTGPQGPAGTDGNDGATGPMGPQGASGNDGDDGLTTLFNSIPETPGINCTNGGYLIEYGLDNDENSILSLGEVSDSFSLCNGEDGAGGLTVGNMYMGGPATNITFQGAGVSVSNAGTDWTVTIPGGGSSQNLSFNTGDNTLTISSGNTVDLPFWSLMGNAIDDTIDFLGTTTNQVLRIVTNGRERITILGGDNDTGGYVGINNQNPEKRLHVNGAIASSLLKVSTGGTTIGLGEFGSHENRMGLARGDFINEDWSGYYTPDDKAFFFPLPRDSEFLIWSGIDKNEITVYFVFIDVQDVNTVILEPGIGEQFIVAGYINGTPGQKLSVIQKDFYLNGSGVGQAGSLGLGSIVLYSDAGISNEIVTGISGSGSNTLDFLFSQLIDSSSPASWSPAGDSYIHFPFAAGMFDGGFDPIYNGGDTNDDFMFQLLDPIGVCNLDLYYKDTSGSGYPVLCMRGVTYVYDGESWLRTIGSI